MNIQDMNNEQLIAHITTLNEQLQNLKEIGNSHIVMEKALKASEERFSFLFNAAPIGLSISNKKGDILSANKTFQGFLGFSMDELKNMNYIDFYTNPNERQRLLDCLNASNHVRDFETLFKHKDGSVWNVLINSDYIELDNEKVILTSLNDITQFKQMQEELKESEERYHVLFSNAPVGITLTDFEGNFSASNQAAQELYGYSPEEFKTLKVSNLYVDKNERQRLLRMSEKNGIVRDFETIFIRKNGQQIHVLINTDLIELEDGKKVLLTSVRDISSIKKAEEELTKERDFINAILETADSLIIVVNHEGRIIRFNNACEKTTGYDYMDVKGRYIWDALSVDPQSARETFKHFLAGRHPSVHEMLWRTKTGDNLLIAWSGAVLLDKNNKVEYAIATGIDITKQRQAEIGLQEANDNLSNWVHELEIRTEEMNLLSEMEGQIQICDNIEEVCAISAQYLRKICRDSHGAIYIINASKNLAEAVEIWGEPVFTEQVFLPANCWATRRSRPHLVNKDNPGLRCEHITGPNDGQYLCVPMMAQGEIVGILHLSDVESGQGQLQQQRVHYDEHKTQMVRSIAEHISLALQNLRLRETLRQQSIRDILTGLFNRRYMEETLDRELRRAEREKTSVGVIMFDIDHFKAFNDLAGHDGGDALLRELGAYMNKNTRGGDIVCRFGGEEFFAVLPGASLENTRVRAEEFRRGVKELLVYHLGKPLGKCTISLGVAAYPQHGTTREEILKSADSALYRAKKEGRDRVVIASV
ncbi:MAG: PAS domain S-box protein [Christensenellales bacterium]